MGSRSSVPQRVLEYATQRDTISIEDVMRDLNVSRTTAKNYLSRLAKMEVIKRIGRGLYQRGEGTTAVVSLSHELWQLAQDLRGRFPMAKFAIWSLNMLADYAHYAIGRDLIFLETDKILSLSFRDALIEMGYRAIPNPSNYWFRNFASYGEKFIFILEREEEYGLYRLEDDLYIRERIEEPLELSGFRNIFIPTPERIWLDVYYFITRYELSFDPAELGLIFANMLSRNRINFNRLLRYANRRGLRDEVIVFLYEIKRRGGWIPDNVLFGRKTALQTLEEMMYGVERA